MVSNACKIVSYPWPNQIFRNINVVRAPNGKKIICFCLDTMHSAKDKHFRSFHIGTEMLSFADSKAESSSSQHMQVFKEEGSLAS
jgi:hypothetical protein